MGRPARPLLAVLIAFGLVVSVQVADVGDGTSAVCPGSSVLEIRRGAPVCVHPSEKAPPGIDVRRRPSVDELKARLFGTRAKKVDLASAEGTAPAEPPPTSVACVGDGVSGKRIQAIYAHPADVPSRYEATVGLIHQYAANADYRINLSAGQSGAGRRVRFVTDSQCALSVEHVTLNSSGDDQFASTVAQLKAAGFDRADRKYLVWMDAAVGMCGYAELYDDDSSGPLNPNDSGPMYARVDAPCWGYAESHELLHTLGAVQTSAPHSTAAGHCVDENDTMCYEDGSGQPLSLVCDSAPEWQVDCGLDDYFNAAPAAGSYLDSHWNTARSSFLEPGPPPPVPPEIVLAAPNGAFAGTAVPVSASVAVPEGRSSTVTWLSSRNDCRFISPAGLTNSFYCAATSTGSGLITAQVTDSLGMSSTASSVLTLTVPSDPRATRLTRRASSTWLRPGGEARLTGWLRDELTDGAIIGMPVSLYARPKGATAWRRIGGRVTGVTGAVRFSVSPRKTTAYRFVSAATPTWGADRSRSLTITV